MFSEKLRDVSWMDLRRMQTSLWNFWSLRHLKTSQKRFRDVLKALFGSKNFSKFFTMNLAVKKFRIFLQWIWLWKFFEFYCTRNLAVKNFENFPERCNMTETSDTLQAVFFLMGKEKGTKNDTINNVTKLFCCLTYLTLLVSCLPNKKKTLKLFFFQLVLSLSLQNKTSTNFSFFGNKTLLGVQTNGHGTILFNKTCLTPWVLLERKNTLRKLNLIFECQTDVLLNKKQKKSNNSLLFSCKKLECTKSGKVKNCSQRFWNKQLHFFVAFFVRNKKIYLTSSEDASSLLFFFKW